jgi:hypothetical protein
MDEQHTPRMVSLNQALLTELPVDEFEAAVSVERLEDRLELGACPVKRKSYRDDMIRSEDNLTGTCCSFLCCLS